MKQEEKLMILNKVLKKYGLSFNDPRVKDFFFRKRELKPQEVVKDKNGNIKFLSFSPHVKPIKQRILPSQFENSGYGTTGHERLIDWYLYENSTGNSLVWENIGNPKFDIKKQFQESGDYGVIRMSHDGKYFNGEDGNHRLLVLMINYFLEQSSPKTPFQLKLFNLMHEMNLDVAIMVSAELANLLDEESIKFEAGVNLGKEETYPALVREYRASTFGNPKESYYMVEYISQLDKYVYNFNGEMFVGTEQELIEWLKVKKQNTEPIMRWQANNKFYVSCYNKVFFTEREAVVKRCYRMLKESYNAGQIEYEDFLEINDIDNELYEIQYPGRFVNDELNSKQYARLLNYILQRYKEVFLHKLTSTTEKDLCDEINHAYKYLSGFQLRRLQYEELTRQEYVQIKDILKNMDAILKNITCKPSDISNN